MGKQVEFKLKEINTKESIDKTTEEEEEVKIYKYTNDLHGVELKVKGEGNANALRLPTGSLNDSILVEFGPKQMQQKLEDDLQDIGKPLETLDSDDIKSKIKTKKQGKKKDRKK